MTDNSVESFGFVPITVDDYELAETALSITNGEMRGASQILCDECGWSLRKRMTTLRRVLEMQGAAEWARR